VGLVLSRPTVACFCGHLFPTGIPNLRRQYTSMDVGTPIAFATFSQLPCVASCPSRYAFVSHRQSLPGQQVYHPTTSGVHLCAAAMSQNGLIDTACFFERVGENRKSVKCSFLVNCFRYSWDGAVIPGEPVLQLAGFDIKVWKFLACFYLQSIQHCRWIFARQPPLFVHVCIVLNAFAPGISPAA
jgi:hypothetical protein